MVGITAAVAASPPRGNVVYSKNEFSAKTSAAGVAGGCGGSTKGQYLQVPVLSPQEGSGRRLLLSLATTQPSQSSSGRAPGHPPPSAPSWVVQGGSGCVVPTSSQGSGAG